MKAKTYNARNPKYIELYSRNPPSMEPNRFDERATATEADLLSSTENTSPEKNNGSVRTVDIIIRLCQRVKLSSLAYVKDKPAINEIKSSP